MILLIVYLLLRVLPEPLWSPALYPDSHCIRGCAIDLRSFGIPLISHSLGVQPRLCHHGGCRPRPHRGWSGSAHHPVALQLTRCPGRLARPCREASRLILGRIPHSSSTLDGKFRICRGGSCRPRCHHRRPDAEHHSWDPLEKQSGRRLRCLRCVHPSRWRIPVRGSRAARGDTAAAASSPASRGGTSTPTAGAGSNATRGGTPLSFWHPPAGDGGFAGSSARLQIKRHYRHAGRRYRNALLPLTPGTMSPSDQWELACRCGKPH